MSNGGKNFEPIYKRKLSAEDLQAKLDLRNGSRTSRIDGKQRAKNRRAENAAAKNARYDYA